MYWIVIFLLSCVVAQQDVHVIVVPLTACNKEIEYNIDDLKQTVSKAINILSVCSNSQIQMRFELLPYVIELPCTYYNTCDVNNLADVVEDTIKNHQLLNSTVQQQLHHIYVLPENHQCDFAGLGQVGCNVSPCKIWIMKNQALIPAVYVHELGHNFGLNHGWLLQPLTEYGDRTDTMTLCCDVRCFNAPHSEQLGTKAPAYIINGNKNVHIVSNKTITLEPNNYIRIQTRSKWFYIQFRVPHSVEIPLLQPSLNIYMTDAFTVGHKIPYIPMPPTYLMKTLNFSNETFAFISDNKKVSIILLELSASMSSFYIDVY